MVATLGLTGLRPDPERAGQVVTPPYDVIKPGTALEAQLRAVDTSIFHVILGDDPKGAIERLAADGALVTDDEPAYYVYEQRWGDETRTGVFCAAEVTPYAEKQVIRHEKTFDDKVKGRIALAEATGHTLGPVFCLTRSPIATLLDEARETDPLLSIETDFGAGSDLTGVRHRVFRVPEDSSLGERIQAALAEEPLYIADGHHRYHAALRNEQTHFLCYATEGARILAYDRVITGTRPFAEVKGELAVEPVEAFVTPEKHAFCIYTREGSYLLRAAEVPEDVVGRLDCAILERELYPKLGLSHDQIVDPKHFDYYPESALDEMKAAVDRGDYEIAVALHPVGLDELMAVADAGLDDPEIVMPEKSTFFSPKILTGVFAYRHEKE